MQAIEIDPSNDKYKADLRDLDEDPSKVLSLQNALGGDHIIMFGVLIYSGFNQSSSVSFIGLL